MPSSMMRPGNFRHDVRGTGVVEVSMAEYLRSKRSILKKIRRRLIMLGIIIGLTALISFLLGVIVATTHDKIVKFHRKSFGVSLRDLYFLYGGVALLFSFHGFYVDGHWASMQKDGNRLVLHLRLYSFIGLASCVAAVWLGFGTLSAFGLVDVRYIIDSPINTIYLVTLVDLCVHLIVTPWLLRTVYRKANQADEYFGAEFVDSVKRSQRSERSARDRDGDSRDGEGQEDEENDDGNDDSEEERRDRRAVVAPASSPRDRITSKTGATPRSPTKSRHAFYGPDGSSRVVGTSVSVRQSARSPRPKIRDLSSQATSPRPATNSPRLSVREVGIPKASEYGVAADAGTSVAASALPHSDHIPYASPVFLLDSQPRLQPDEFWRLWKVSETTGSFSCPFTNHPHRDDVATHLQTFGFHVITVKTKDNALQVYFYAFQLSTDTFFMGEFVLLFARQFFQATFKCKEHDAAPDFVARFNLQELLVATDDS